MRCVCLVYVLAILRHGFGIPSGEEGKCKINQAAHNEQPDLFMVKLKGVFYSCISSEFACGTDCRFTALSRRNSSSFFGKHFVGFPQNYSAIKSCITTLAL